MLRLDKSGLTTCKKFLNDLIEISKADNSIKFFRKDISTMLIWLFIMEAYSRGEKINIEDIARGISVSTSISKPSLRLILENAKQKGYLRFTHNNKDNRSWIIEPETATLNEFNSWINSWEYHLRKP
tara:strand:- start:751 stop:1131 length:381 start_codon:yes stop_codon:yes gene_type:complete